MKQSLALTEFYREYYAWVQDGAGEHPFFRRNHSLCAALFRYYRGLAAELEHQLIDAFPEKHLYPFNEDRYHFMDELKNSSMHQNPLRIKWVKDHM